MKNVEGRPGYPVFSRPSTDVTYIKGVNFYRHYEQHRKGARPIVIYPPLGNVWIALEYFGQRFGIKTLTQLERDDDSSKPQNPPNINKETENLGTQYSPEGICGPFKSLMGYTLQSAIRFEKLREAMGDDVIYPVFMTHESTGLCRERTYGRLAEAHLHDYYMHNFGHANFDFYILKDSVQGVMEFVSFLLDVSGRNIGASRFRIITNFIDTVNLINEAIERLDMAEIFEKDVRYTQSLISENDFHKAEVILQGARLALASGDLPNNKKSGVTHVMRQKLEDLPERKVIPGGNLAKAGEVFLANVLDEMHQRETAVIGEIPLANVLDEMHQRLNALPRIREIPKGVIAIAGEIFMVEEMASSAADLGSVLGKLGYYYVKTVGHSHYTHKVRLDLERLSAFLIRKLNPLHRDQKAELAAKAGLRRDVGGHSLDTGKLATLINEGKADYDGVIEMFPYNCLPQIMAANIVKCEIPWLRLLFGEQAGRAGIITRVEASLDTIERRKQKAKERRSATIGIATNQN
ncbi:hypothetical protein HYU45_01305 [Candidatus Daviesbacteria bacterium]|nr:hypothetical protein [Candidatus Daviesbacteria bacterium]